MTDSILPGPVAERIEATLERMDILPEVALLAIDVELVFHGPSWVLAAATGILWLRP
jgi:hypothetical protein